MKVSRPPASLERTEEVIAYVSLDSYFNSSHVDGGRDTRRVGIFAQEVTESSDSSGLDVEAVVSLALDRLEALRRSDRKAVEGDFSVLRVTIVSVRDQFSAKLGVEALKRLARSNIQIHIDVLS